MFFSAKDDAHFLETEFKSSQMYGFSCILHPMFTK